MGVTKPYKFTRFGAMDVTTPHNFIGFRGMDGTKQYKFKPRGPKSLILKSRPGNRRFWGSKRPSSSSKPTGAGGRRSPPPAPMGFEEEDGRFDPKQINDFGADFLKTDF